MVAQWSKYIQSPKEFLNLKHKWIYQKIEHFLSYQVTLPQGIIILGVQSPQGFVNSNLKQSINSLDVSEIFTSQKKKKTLPILKVIRMCLTWLVKIVSSSLRSQGLSEFMFQLQRFLLNPQNAKKYTMLVQSVK